MSVRLIRKILRLSLFALIFVFFTGSCAPMDQLDRFIYGGEIPGPNFQQEPHPERRVPLPPTIKDFKSRPPYS
jgi:hypothetical protein